MYQELNRATSDHSRRLTEGELILKHSLALVAHGLPPALPPWAGGRRRVLWRVLRRDEKQFSSPAALRRLDPPPHPTCQYFAGDPRAGAEKCNEASAAGSSFCAHHHRVCYVPNFESEQSEAAV